MDPEEKRQHVRQEVVMVVLISPNGHAHQVPVCDLSEGGVRVGLPGDWEAEAGTRLRLYFVLPRQRLLALSGQVVRVAVDHLGVQFAPAQADEVRQLLDEVQRLG